MCPRYPEIPIDQTQSAGDSRLLMQHAQCPAALLHNRGPWHGLAVETRAELKMGFCAAAVEFCRRKSGTARDSVWDGAAF
jgi:hypothetical protein